MSKKSKELTLLANVKPEEVEEEEQAESDNEQSVEAVKEVKVKKPRTAKQIEVFLKARETAKANALKRKLDKDMAVEKEQKEIEEKLIQKALSFKKKQIKRQAFLDEISDDDTPIEEIQKIKKKIEKKEVKQPLPLPKQEVPKYIFV